jgi:superfamily II DNA/RNA helicase
LLPALARLLEAPRRLGAIVLTPTRELAAKVETDARDYARFTGLRIAVVFGGAPIQTQSGRSARVSICWWRHRDVCSNCRAGWR